MAARIKISRVIQNSIKSRILKRSCTWLHAWKHLSSSTSSDDDNNKNTNGQQLFSILKGMDVVSGEGKRSQMGEVSLTSKDLSDSSSSESSDESSSSDEDDVVEELPSHIKVSQSQKESDSSVITSQSQQFLDIPEDQRLPSPFQIDKSSLISNLKEMKTISDVGTEPSVQQESLLQESETPSEITSLKMTASQQDSSSSVSSELLQPFDLAKPTPKKKVTSKINLDKEEKSDVKEEVSSLDPELLKAVKEVSTKFQGDPTIIEYDLLQKLQSHSIEINSGEKLNDIQLSQLLSGMEVDRHQKQKMNLKKNTLLEEKLQFFQNTFHSILNVKDGVRSRTSRTFPKIFRSKATENLKYDLFCGPCLNIFTSENLKEDSSLLVTWKKLIAMNLKQLTVQPIRNGYEEMIQWTEENKLWHFPINNEQGLEEEAKVGFHEHIFLEHHLEEGFPQKGPIRQFMELVCIGLSKNPYITVQEKKDHIDWYRQYFKEKEEFLQEIKTQ